MIEEKEKPVTEFQQLRDEGKHLEDEIQAHEASMSNILEPVPTLRSYFKIRDMEESEPPFKTLVWGEDPLTGELVPERFLLSREFGEAEKLAEPVVEGLRAAIDEGRGRIQLISVKAAIAEAQSPEGDKQTKNRKRRGPRKSTIPRRSHIKLLNRQGIKGREACEKLTALGIDLPSKRRREIYENDWVMWFDTDPQGFYRQWSADLKRA